MENNIALNARVEESLLLLHNSSVKKIPPMYRRRIYEAFGDLNDPLVQYKRAYLDLLSAKKVLPIWEDFAQNNQENESPTRVVSITEDVLKNVLSKQQGLTLAQKYMRELDDDSDAIDEEMIDASMATQEVATSESESVNPGLVMHAAVEALYSASGVFSFDDVLIENETTDTNFDMWSSDTARWAVSAYAGEEWSAYSSSIRRGEFWEWWLHEAIPAAWRSIPD